MESTFFGEGNTFRTLKILYLHNLFGLMMVDFFLVKLKFG